VLLLLDGGGGVVALLLLAGAGGGGAVWRWRWGGAPPPWWWRQGGEVASPPWKTGQRRVRRPQLCPSRWRGAQCRASISRTPLGLRAGQGWRWWRRRRTVRCSASWPDGDVPPASCGWHPARCLASRQGGGGAGGGGGGRCSIEACGLTAASLPPAVDGARRAVRPRSWAASALIRRTVRRSALWLGGGVVRPCGWAAAAALMPSLEGDGSTGGKGGGLCATQPCGWAAASLPPAMDGARRAVCPRGWDAAATLMPSVEGGAPVSLTAGRGRDSRWPRVAFGAPLGLKAGRRWRWWRR
jgi:hypothetical protein